MFWFFFFWSGGGGEKTAAQVHVSSNSLKKSYAMSVCVFVCVEECDTGKTKLTFQKQNIQHVHVTTTFTYCAWYECFLFSVMAWFVYRSLFFYSFTDKFSVLSDPLHRYQSDYSSSSESPSVTSDPDYRQGNACLWEALFSYFLMSHSKYLCLKVPMSGIH